MSKARKMIAPWRCACGAPFHSHQSALQHVRDVHGKKGAPVGIYRRVTVVEPSLADEIFDEIAASMGMQPTDEGYDIDNGDISAALEDRQSVSDDDGDDDDMSLGERAALAEVDIAMGNPTDDDWLLG